MMVALGARTERRLTVALALAISVMFASCYSSAPPPAPPAPPAPAPAPPQAKTEAFRATAYTIEGRTASGKWTRRGVVAADPAVLPVGSRIQVSDAGGYDGEYVVADTGRKVRGRHIDIYLPDNGEAKRFGKKQVRVEVLQYGQR